MIDNVVSVAIAIYTAASIAIFTWQAQKKSIDNFIVEDSFDMVVIRVGLD